MNFCGISASWFENDISKRKSQPPHVGEICSLRIEGNYELEKYENFWVNYETWDSNQNGISKKEHIDTNKLCYGEIRKIEREESNFIDCKFQVNQILSINNKISPKPIDDKWKTIILDFAKIDFTGSLLTVNKFDNYLTATRQTDGGPFYNFVFEKGNHVQLRQVIECDKFADPLIRFTNEILDLNLTNILHLELKKGIKIFRHQEKDFNKFLFYLDENDLSKLKNEILKGNKVVLTKGWKREMIKDVSEIESTLKKMNDYH